MSLVTTPSLLDKPATDSCILVILKAPPLDPSSGIQRYLLPASSSIGDLTLALARPRVLLLGSFQPMAHERLGALAQCFSTQEGALIFHS